MSRHHEPKPHDGVRWTGADSTRPPRVGGLFEFDGLRVVHLGRTAGDLWVFVEQSRFGSPTARTDWILLRSPERLKAVGRHAPIRRDRIDRRGSWQRRSR